MGGRSSSFSSKGKSGGGISLQLSDLEGSNKQVKWAEDIRDGWKKEIDEFNKLTPEQQEDVLFNVNGYQSSNLNRLLRDKVQSDSENAEEYLDEKYGDKGGDFDKDPSLWSKKTIDYISKDPTSKKAYQRLKYYDADELFEKENANPKKRLSIAKDYIKRAISNRDASDIIESRRLLDIKDGHYSFDGNSPKDYINRLKK